MQSFKLVNKANELYDYSFTYILNKMPNKAKTFRISLETELYGLIGKYKYVKIKRVHGFLGILNDTKKMMYGWIKEK